MTTIKWNNKLHCVSEFLNLTIKVSVSNSRIQAGLFMYSKIFARTLKNKDCKLLKILLYNFE